MEEDKRSELEEKNLDADRRLKEKKIENFDNRKRRRPTFEYVTIIAALISFTGSYLATCVSFPESRPVKIREINFKPLNLMAYEKIKIYRNTNCFHSQSV